MHFPFPLRLKWRSMAVAMVAALMMAVLTVGSVLAQGHVANDGQTLAMQSPEVQMLFASAHGDDAAAQWVSEHNAAIGPAQPAMPAVSASADYFRVRHVAYMRSGDLDMADRITADVIARGTVDEFLAGMDMGVIYGYVAPAPQPRAAPSSSSSSTSSGPSEPKSPSTSTVTGWVDITLHWLEGANVSLTLPSSSDPKVTGYALSKESGLEALGLKFDSMTRQITSTMTAKIGKKFEGVYSAKIGVDKKDDIGEPFKLMLSITVTKEDSQPVFRNRSIAPIRVVEGEDINKVKLPLASSGNGTLKYTISGEPEGIVYDKDQHELSGGKATKTGSYAVTYTAEDDDGDTASLTFTITVEKDTYPVPPSIGSMTFTVGEAIAGRFLPEGSGGNGDLTYKLFDYRTIGLEFEENTRWLSGTPKPLLTDDLDSMTYTVTYQVSDTGGKMNDKSTTFTITVEAAD